MLILLTETQYFTCWYMVYIDVQQHIRNQIYLQMFRFHLWISLICIYRKTWYLCNNELLFCYPRPCISPVGWYTSSIYSIYVATETITCFNCTRHLLIFLTYFLKTRMDNVSLSNSLFSSFRLCNAISGSLSYYIRRYYTYVVTETGKCIKMFHLY